MVALVVGELMEKRLGMLGEPYKQGSPGMFNRVAKALSAAGARRARGGGAS